MKKENKEPRDKQGKAHGYWEVYWNNGNLQYKGVYIHGIRYGRHIDYYTNGNINYNEYFIHGYRFGVSKSHKPNSDISYIDYYYYNHFGLYTTLYEIYESTKGKLIL